MRFKKKKKKFNVSSALTKTERMIFLCLAYSQMMNMLIKANSNSMKYGFVFILASFLMYWVKKKSSGAIHPLTYPIRAQLSRLVIVLK